MHKKCTFQKFHENQICESGIDSKSAIPIGSFSQQIVFFNVDEDNKTLLLLIVCKKAQLYNDQRRNSLFQ